MIKILYIALGSALGGVGRYLVGKVFSEHITTSFPIGTFLVNMLGCLIIGFVYGLLSRGTLMSEEAKLFLTVGFCGGLTTFSTFMHENYMMAGQHHFLMVALYASVSLFVGFLCAYLGHYVAENMLP